MRKHQKTLFNTIKTLGLASAFLCISCQNINVVSSISSSLSSSSSSSSSASSSLKPEVCDLDGSFTDDDYLSVKGNKVINGLGEEIYLRGVNIGGLFVTESWMSAPRMSHGQTDHLTLTNTLYERFGEEKTQKIWATFRETFWQEEDLENLEFMKINCVRLPFSYMTVDPIYHNVPQKEGQEFNFDLLDEFIEGCARYGIYVILDLHGAYGSQNGQDHSGQVINNIDDVDFFYNEENQNKTIHLWQELAKHYQGVNAIAAYDILNEPGEKGSSTTERHFLFFDKVYEAIREVDTKRPIIIESCWEGNNLPAPSLYQWNSVIYSFHHYTGDSNMDSHLASFQNKINGVYSQPYHETVPYYMGEFNCYGNQNSWRNTLSFLNLEKWHWSSWTYKLNLVDGYYPGWGIYYSHSDYIYFDRDSYEDILLKISKISTQDEDVEKMTFDNTVTLERIMRTYCAQ